MSSIQKSLTSGVFYTGIAKYSNIVFAIVIGAVLARLLSPEEFGIVALVTVFVTFFNLLGDFGIGKAVVQNQNLTKHDVRSIFSFSILFAIALGSLFFLAAPLIASFYDSNELVNITRWLSLAVLFYTLQSIPRALLEKALKFKIIGIVTVITQMLTGAIAIVLAYRGFSYYALVIMSILNSFTLFVLYFAVAPIKIVFRINLSSIKKILKFSLFNLGFNFINYFSRNGDNLLIGKFLGATALGFYDKAYRLMLLPVQNLTHVITPAMMPVFSKYQDDKHIVFSTYLKVVKILANIGFPLSVLLFFSSYEIIILLFGNQWIDSVPVFKIVSLTIGIQVIYSSAGSVFQSVNRTDLLFYYGIIGAIILLSGISYGVFIGNSIETVGYGLLVAFALNFLIVFYMLIKKALGCSYLLFLKTVSYPLLISLVMAVPLGIYSKWVGNGNLFTLIVKLIIAILSFLTFFIVKKENRKLLRVGVKVFIQKMKPKQ